MLLRKNDEYFQILEGEQSDIITLYGKICKDERHTDCEILSIDCVDERCFTEWSMGFISLDDTDLSSVEGYNNFMNENECSKDLFRSLSDSERAATLFKELSSNLNRQMIRLTLG